MIDRYRLALDVDVGALRADLQRLAEAGWTPHFNTGYYTGDWSGVVLRSPGGLDETLFTGGSEDVFQDTPAMSACPAVRAFLESLRCPLRSVRLLRLSAGSRILEHRDYGLGVSTGEVRLHIPIVTHPDVEFHLNNQRVTMAEGEVWYLDLGQPHRVFNASPIDRVHLVVDVEVNDWLRDQAPFYDDDPRMMGVAEAVAAVSRDQSDENFEAFRADVHDDPVLHATLFATADRALFISEAMRLGVERGRPFSDATVERALSAGRDAWWAACAS